MNNRGITQIVAAQEVTEGAGVSVFRSIGTRERRNLDPFLMLDQFSTYNPDDYIAGFPNHPHRGFNTFTYMIDGHMVHGDSMGNRGDLGPGGAQWMKAGSGVIHSEMPQQERGRMRGFQLWINLPADQKMTSPEYQDVPPDLIAEVNDGASRIRVIAGDFDGIQGPVADPNTGFQFLDVTLSADNTFVHRLPGDDTAFLYLFEGAAYVGDTRVEEQQLVVLGEGDQVTVAADDNDCRFLLVAGSVIGEPIVQYGPFVMNTREEIEQALADYRDGKLVQTRANMIKQN
jgi:redox-sensitive bicupin YhaK (pirin superfamily)